MTYIDYIRNFWMQQSFYLFTPTEIALYFYLLESANVRKWPDTFTCINRKIEIDLGVSYKTLAAAKNRLRQTELIDFKSKNGSKTTTFSLTYGNITKVGGEVREEVLGEVLGEVGDEVSLAHNKVPVKDIKTKTNYNNIPPLSPKGENEQEIKLRELEQNLANREAELKKREEALEAAGKKAGKTKNPPSRLNSEARKVFEEYYLATFSSDYYWTPKDAGSMTSLLQKLKFQRTQKNLTTDDEGILNALSYLLKSISDGWLLEHLSVSNINAYFNEIVSQAKGKHLSNKAMPLFSQQQVPPSKIENLQQTGESAAEIAQQILNGNG